MSLTLGEVQRALGQGNSTSAIVFGGVSTDTRSIKPGDLFVALVGKEADGHRFIPQALRAGASGLVVSQVVDIALDVPVVQVPDTEVAYGKIARTWRDHFDIPVIGVTGSVGKTTLKEMLASALSPLGAVLKTAASQNNETGVPKALLQLTSEHNAAVIEMGMRGSGQIAYLCAIANPTIGVITVIADNHLELLGSRDAIADAKGELLEYLPPDGIAVLNSEDPYLSRLRSRTAAQVVTFGGTEPQSYFADKIEQTESGWKFQLRGVSVTLNSLSRHDISNALAALAVADSLGVPLAEAVHGLQTYTPPPMRMQITATDWGGTILNDSYNAAPASVASALETLTTHSGGRKIAFLGDMRELGARAEEAHRELGSVIETLGGLDSLYTVGPLAELIPGAANRFTDSADASRFVHQEFVGQSGDLILVKGSRAMGMEQIAEALKSPHDPPKISPISAGLGGG